MVHDGTPPPYARDGPHNRLDPAAVQPDGTPAPGIQCEFTAGNKAMPLPLPRLTRVLPHVEWLTLALQQVALGG